MAVNSFAALKNGSNNFTRKFGTVASAVEPYTTGFHFINFNYLPANLYKRVNSHSLNSVVDGNIDIKNILAGSIQSTTIPTKTLNKTEHIGLGGVRWGNPTNLDVDSTISMRFLEWSGTPIRKIFHGWVRTIRDLRTGVSNLEGNQYSKADYAGSCYYWTTKPDGVTIEYSALFTGIFPLKDPSELFGHDLGANDKLEIDIDFHVDWVWEEPWVEEVCADHAKKYKNNAMGTINKDYAPEGA